MFCYYLMPVIFIIGILAIAFEDLIKVNKAATAVGMLILLWIVNAISVLVWIGCASALFGTQGVISTAIRKRREKNNKDE